MMIVSLLDFKNAQKFV